MYLFIALRVSSAYALFTRLCVQYVHLFFIKMKGNYIELCIFALEWIK
jgi:hypothetical protein